MILDKAKHAKMAKNIFLGGLSLKIILVLGKAMFKVLLPHFAWFFVLFDKLIRPHPGPLWVGGRLGKVGGDDLGGNIEKETFEKKPDVRRQLGK